MRARVICLSLTLCFVLAPGGMPVTAETSNDLVAHWTFDELAEGTFRNATGGGLDGCVEAGASLGAGVLGTALWFDGRSVARIRAHDAFKDLANLTISAWVKPTELSGYREIFRKEDGASRILFSFQNHGRILALGLRTAGTGYQELDAPIDPAMLIDDQWHHVAGTCDGERMTVYLDGLVIGSQKRTGRVISGGAADAFIGSSGGTGEFFQGAIDELQIFKVALPAEAIAGLFEKRLSAVLAEHGKHRQQAESLYQEKAAFAETMAATRGALIEETAPDALVRIIQSKLATQFPGAYSEFLEITGSQPRAYLTASGNSWNVEQTQRLMGWALEYKPLTEGQWARLGEGERAKWQETEARFAQLEKMAQTAARQTEWIEGLLEAGRQIVRRPVQHEPVAPYVKPYTPQTRDYSAAEAEEIIRRDWLHQAGGAVTADRTKNEITWARDLAARIAYDHGSKVDFSKELTELEALETRMADGVDEELYLAVRRIKRRIMFANPVVDFDRVLFVDIPFPQGSEWPHETRHRLGYMAVPGGRLLILNGLSPAGHLTKLMPFEPLHGTFWRPDLSFDAQRVLVSFHPANEKNFHLYEINIDGSGLRQITDGIYDDVDPIYLPDGEHIVFGSTRGHNYVRCMPPTNSFTLTRCRLDGKHMYLISRNNEPDYLPALLADGRVIYTRWEYTDKPLWRAQSLWTMRPDGTQAATFWGNQTVWPDLLKDVRPIPGSERVMFTGSAHHNWFSGSIGIVDTRIGLNFPHGLTKVTAELEWPESGNGPVDPIESDTYHTSGDYRAYQNPYPLSETDFLVSANRAGKFVLYLMDTNGNRELIYEAAHNILHAMPVKPRPKPPVMPSTVRWPTMAERHDPADGVIYSNNVYQGAPAQLRDKARYLRILTMDAKTYSYWYKRPYASTGPVVSMVSSEGVKRIVGTVPIERDGSVCFHAPSGKSLYFQLLDEQYRALQTMRSISGVMPGETRGCLGCHEMHGTAPVATSSAPALALARPPSSITPPPWGDESISYMRFVQPVLDKYCGQCHQGDGEARQTLDLTFRGDGLFKEPYVLLLGNPSWGAPYDPPENPPAGFGIADTILVEAFDQRDPAAYATLEPMTKLSYRSRLVDRASNGKHHDVKVDEVSRRRLIAWVDAMGPYRGDEEVRQIADPMFQGIDWLSMRPQIQNAPVVVRPGPIENGF
jgi:Concanavalin A-like lectin/glucanases superfamily/Hydrazine synthase alpha subunit middle domain